jgi:hypothetical protein
MSHRWSGSLEKLGCGQSSPGATVWWSSWTKSGCSALQKAEAHDLLWMLPAPDCLLGAAGESTNLAGRAVDPWVDRDLPDIERPGLVAIEIGPSGIIGTASHAKRLS